MLSRKSPPRKSSDQQLGKRPPGGRRNVAHDGDTAGKNTRATSWENRHTKGYHPVNSNSYLPDFETDVFISYTHTDNQPFGEDQECWIARWHSRLETRVEQFLGSKVSIFRDEKLQGNDDFAEVLLEQLERVATLVCIVSPRYFHSEWCIRELTGFFQAAKQSGGLQVGKIGRLRGRGAR